VDYRIIAVMLVNAKTREISGKTVRSSFGRLLSMVLLCIFIDRLIATTVGMSLYI